VFLRYQLASLVRCGNVSVSVCYTPSDELTVAVLDWIEGFELPLERIDLKKGELFRRSIGRNIAALGSTEDLVWFTDVDHVFMPHCFGELQKIWGELDHPRPAMIYPGTIQIQATHELGDELVRTYNHDKMLFIDPAEFVPKTYTRAIGGVQIVDGEIARRYGYLDKSKKYQEVTDGNHPFPNFRDDIAYRNKCKTLGGVKQVQFGGLYRLRHTLKTY
jgi:hypothetical protein